MTGASREHTVLRVTGTGRDGRRYYDEQDRLRLARACLKPDVCLSEVARQAGIHASLLHKWVMQEREVRSGMPASRPAPVQREPAFVPVLQARSTPAQAQASLAPPPALAPASPRVDTPAPGTVRLDARLPGGVTLTLTFRAQDSALVSALPEPLGACHVAS